VDAAAAPSAFVVGPPIILSPPAYADLEASADARPPPYYPYQSSSSGGPGTPPPRLCSVADLPSVQPTAPSNSDPPTSSASSNVTLTPAYGNPAYSDSGV